MATHRRGSSPSQWPVADLLRREGRTGPVVPSALRLGLAVGGVLLAGTAVAVVLSVTDDDGDEPTPPPPTVAPSAAPTPSGTSGGRPAAPSPGPAAPPAPAPPQAPTARQDPSPTPEGPGAAARVNRPGRHRSDIPLQARAAPVDAERPAGTARATGSAGVGPHRSVARHATPAPASRAPCARADEPPVVRRTPAPAAPPAGPRHTRTDEPEVAVAAPEPERARDADVRSNVRAGVRRGRTELRTAVRSATRPGTAAGGRHRARDTEDARDAPRLHAERVTSGRTIPPTPRSTWSGRELGSHGGATRGSRDGDSRVQD